MVGEPFCDVGTPSLSPDIFTWSHLMKKEWMVTNVTVGRSPDSSRTCYFEGDFGWSLFFANSGRICGRGVTLWCRKAIFLSSNNFTTGHLIKIKWLVTDVTAVESPERADRAILGELLGAFWSIQAVFVAGEPLCGVGTPS